MIGFILQAASVRLSISQAAESVLSSVDNVEEAISVLVSLEHVHKQVVLLQDVLALGEQSQVLFLLQLRQLLSHDSQ